MKVKKNWLLACMVHYMRDSVKKTKLENTLNSIVLENEDAPE